MTCPCGKKSACASQQQPVNNNTDTDPCSNMLLWKLPMQGWRM
ncbi:1573_t:CDS:2 [Funneliformis geosporum]|uniref:1573_t:CDS:1 n=1 Tax=Funneliformis geosporum TaxID=1117311 RepID=A0A9W4SXB3_9GLOM|nr:1573_t:CDS:2 [Funneliformis geosporum]